MGSIKEEASGRVYLVDYDEDLWLSYDDEGRQQCIDAWLRKAEPLRVAFLSVRLHPDKVFPLHGHEGPYIAVSLPVAPKDGTHAFTVKTIAIAEIHPDLWHQLDEAGKADARVKAMHAAVRTGADGCLVRIGSKGGHILDSRGKA